MSESQQQRFDAPDPPTRTRPATVYVVAAHHDGDPHPHIEAVYDNEAAAEAHQRWIADERPISIIAWGVHEQEVLTDETPVPEREEVDR